MKKEEFSDLMSFAIDEYAGLLEIKGLVEASEYEMQFGSLSVTIQYKKVDNGRLFIREYWVYEDGNCVLHFVLGLAAMLFSHSSRKFRESILAVNSIKGVVTLKQRLFSVTTLPASMIFFENTKCNTWLSTAETIEDVWNLVSGHHESRTVFYTDELSGESFMPEFYNGMDKRIEKALSVYETKPLDEVAEIINGKNANRQELAEEGIPYLRARAIQNGKIIKDEMCVKMEAVGQFSRQLLQSGDILLTKFFGQYKLVQVSEEDLPAIASNAMFIIRPFGVSEKYLYRYLTSKTGNEIFRQQLERVQHGVTISSVSMKDLKTLQVPIYDEQMMMDIENLDLLDNQQLENAAKRILSSDASMVGQDLEKAVLMQLSSKGWDSVPVNHNLLISLGDGISFKPDLCYELDGMPILVEVKTSLARVSPKWIAGIQQLLDSKSGNAVLILTTGNYFEVHKAGSTKVLRLSETPSPEQIASWIKEEY